MSLIKRTGLSIKVVGNETPPRPGAFEVVMDDGQVIHSKLVSKAPPNPQKIVDAIILSVQSRISLSSAEPIQSKLTLIVPFLMLYNFLVLVLIQRGS